MNKFTCMVIDCPYGFSDKLSMDNVARGAEANYPVMTNTELLNLNIKELADPEGCLLALWVPSSLLSLGLELMKKWGFEQKQTYIWVKTKKEPFSLIQKDLKSTLKKYLKEKKSLSEVKNDLLSSFSNLSINTMLGFFLGRLFRQVHEICLIGTNNNKIYKKLQNKSQRSVCFAPNLKHSAKPEDLQNSLDIMFPGTEKIEIFARRQKQGWICLGNEIDGKDIRDAIKELTG